MQKANRLLGIQHTSLFFLAALLVIAVDQLSKLWIRSNLPLGQSLPITDWVKLTHVSNTGSAFGLFPGQSFFLTIVAITGIAFLLVLAFYGYRWLPFLNNIWSWVALGLILGGTIGNLIDRIRFGGVTDFVDFGFWPAFNAADSAIVVGVVMLACRLLFSLRAGKQRED